MNQRSEGMLKGVRSDELMDAVVRQNLQFVAWLGLGAGLLQGLALWALKSVQVAAALKGCAWVGAVGLIVLGLFALQQRKRSLSSGFIQGLTLFFVLWYVLADGLIGYLAAQMPGLWCLPAGMLLLAVLALPVQVRVVLWGLYGILTVMFLGGSRLLPYGLGLTIAGALLSWVRWRQAVQAAQSRQDQQGTEAANKQLHQSLASASTIDAETGVANRRAMSAWLEAVWPLCVRNRIPVEIIMIGGEAKKTAELAKALKPVVRRQSDYLGRFDETTFVILFSGPSREDAAMLLERVTEAVQPGCGVSLFAGFVLPRYRMVAAQALTWSRQEWEAMVRRGENAVLEDYSPQ